jgi:hypothetical protein
MGFRDEAGVDGGASVCLCLDALVASLTVIWQNKVMALYAMGMDHATACKWG